MTASASAPSSAGSLIREAGWVLAGVSSLIGAGVLGVGGIWLIDVWSPEAFPPVEELNFTLWLVGLVTVVISVVVTSATTNWERRGMIAPRFGRTCESLVLILLIVVAFAIWYVWIANYCRRSAEHIEYVWVTGYLVLSSCGMLALLWFRRWWSGLSIAGWHWLTTFACIAATVAAFYVVAAPLVIAAMLLGLTSIWGGRPAWTKRFS